MINEKVLSKTTVGRFMNAIQNNEVILWEDPGHGWLQVPKEIVKQVQLETRIRISGYSYKDSNFYYLEEDCDCPAFCNCFTAIDWKSIPRKYKENIFIRNLNHV